MKILMIRHFPTPGNIEKRYVGRTDEDLAGEDLEIQVRTVRGRLKDHGSVEYVAASPMKRCVQTAALLFAGRAPLLFDELREWDFGLFEGHNYEELKDGLSDEKRRRARRHGRARRYDNGGPVPF